MPDRYPALRAVCIDAVDARAVAEFYGQLLGLVYRPGDEPPPGGDHDARGEDWLVLRDRDGEARIAVQHVAELPASTWPSPEIPQQLHLDMTVASREQLVLQRDRALSLGARILQDRMEDPLEPLYVFADPAGHPFCIFVSPDHPA